MNRTTRLALTGALALTAALTVGGAASAAQAPPSEPAARTVAVQDPSPGQPGAPDGRDCPLRHGDGRGTAPSAPAPTPAPTPAASTA